MPRLKRVAPVGVSQHVIQRGNNKQVCFNGEPDKVAYIHWLKEYAKKYQVDIHAWVLMSNHVHLLCTPQQTGAVSKMMQSLGRAYVRHFNRKHEHSGTLWEGRYKASLIDSERYLLEVYRYIELNPVRANMVDEPGQYKWSSYHCNAMGLASDLCTPHDLYLRLGTNSAARRKAYRGLFNVALSKGLIADLRACTNSGTAFGEKVFVEQLESVTKARVSHLKMGRPLLKRSDLTRR